MYQVIKMYGDWEPWWFLDDWREAIVSEENFPTFEQAFSTYEKEWHRLRHQLPSYKSLDKCQATFWDKKEQRWCEECDEFLQQYHSILLLKDGEELSSDYIMTHLQQHNDEPVSPTACSLKK